MIQEDFQTAAPDPRLVWFNPPGRWRIDPSLPGLVVEPDGGTDFWQRTHYGFRADNGHFLGMETPGDFIISTLVRFYPAHQYDQAGLMIRADESCWIKASVEHEPEGPPQLGTVVTSAGFSDWSLQDSPFRQNAIRLRITKRGADVLVEFAAADSDRWAPMRVARLQHCADAPIRAGLYACSPKGAGFRAEFAYLRIETSSD